MQERPVIVRGVRDTYIHVAKLVRAVEVVRIGDAVLKLYEVAPENEPVGEDLAQEARLFLLRDETRRELDLHDERGFAILHRCGADFHFLLVSVWRGSNELWEAVYYCDGADRRFRRFDAAYPAAGYRLRPTFCVWELGVVCHEAKVWTQYLESGRSHDDGAEWQQDVMSGTTS